MSNAPEEFEEIQKLLKLKRYEQPPPGYFNNFSTLVINRLEREGAQSAAQSSWINRFLASLETNPFAAGTFGMSVCALLVSGIAWSQYRPPIAATDSNMNLAVTDAGLITRTPAWKTASVDSLNPTMAVFSTGTNSGMLFDGMASPSAQLIIDRQ